MAWNSTKATGGTLDYNEYNNLVDAVAPQGYSYLIYKEGTTINARSKEGNITYSGTNAKTAIDTALAEGSGKIKLLNGVYDYGANVIDVPEGVYLQGESRGYWNDSTSGTVITCSGIDCSELQDFGLSDLKIVAKTANMGNGILIGYTGTTYRPKYLKLSHLKIYDFTTGILGQNTAPDDTALVDCYINGCTTGLSGLSSMTRMFGGGITQCPTGMNLYHTGTILASVHCFGTVFSGNGIDITFTGTGNIDHSSFYGCWFEASTTGVLYINPTSAFAVPNVLFSNCSLVAGASYLFDLRGTNFARVVLDGGSVVGGTVYVDSNALFECRKLYGENTITMNGTGMATFSYFQEKNILSPNFAIDSTGVKTVTIPHGMLITPGYWECSLTVIQGTDVDDWAYNMLKITNVDATNVYVKINVSSASATGGAVAKLGLRVGNP